MMLLSHSATEEHAKTGSIGFQGRLCLYGDANSLRGRTTPVGDAATVVPPPGAPPHVAAIADTERNTLISSPAAVRSQTYTIAVRSVTIRARISVGKSAGEGVAEALVNARLHSQLACVFAYCPISLIRACAARGTGTAPSRICLRSTLAPYMAQSPVSSACTTAPSKLIPANAPLLRE
jgi:hypothetical protein